MGVTVSLKTFHIIFVTASTILTIGFGIWAIRDYRSNGDTTSLVVGVGSLIGSVGLVWYGRWFITKLKGIKCV